MTVYAFPSRVSLVHDDDQGKDYPDFSEAGMELRDWFAGKALGVIGKDLPHRTLESVVDIAYQIADAMMERRKRR